MVQENILNPVLERRGLETKGPDFAEEKFQFEMSPSQKKVLGLKTADINAVTFDKPEFDRFVDLFSQRDEMGRALYPEQRYYRFLQKTHKVIDLDWIQDYKDLKKKLFLLRLVE